MIVFMGFVCDYRHNSMRVDEGRNSWNVVANNEEDAYRSGEGGEEPV